MWEEELIEDPDKPEKFAILLKHEYTETNLSFANLKGHDLGMADNLRSSGAFEVHLVLITRHKNGSAAYDHSRYKRRRWGGYSSESESSGTHFMEDVNEDTIKIEKWVNETGAEVENEDLEIDYDHETVDGEALFHRDSNYYRKMLAFSKA